MFALARGLAFSYLFLERGEKEREARDFSFLSFLFLFFSPVPLLLFVRSFLGNTRNLVLIEFKQGSGWSRRRQSRSVQQNFNERTLPIGSRGNLKASEKGRGGPGSIFVERG